MFNEAIAVLLTISVALGCAPILIEMIADYIPSK